QILRLVMSVDNHQQYRRRSRHRNRRYTAPRYRPLSWRGPYTVHGVIHVRATERPGPAGFVCCARIRFAQQTNIEPAKISDERRIEIVGGRRIAVVRRVIADWTERRYSYSEVVSALSGRSRSFQRSAQEELRHPFSIRFQL